MLVTLTKSDPLPLPFIFILKKLSTFIFISDKLKHLGRSRWRRWLTRKTYPIISIYPSRDLGAWPRIPISYTVVGITIRSARGTSGGFPNKSRGPSDVAKAFHLKSRGSSECSPNPPHACRESQSLEIRHFPDIASLIASPTRMETFLAMDCQLIKT